MRFRLYPDTGQAQRLASWSHTCRTVWNTALAQRIWAYKSARRATVRAVEQCAELTEARREHDWLRDLPAQCAQQVLRQLGAAYDNFWNPHHPAGFPQFKKKHHGQGVTFPGQAVAVHKVSRRTAQVKLPKIGWVRIRLSRPIDGTVRNATVSRDGLAGTSRSVSTSPSQRRRLSTRARRSVLMWGSRARCSFPTKTGSGSARPPSLQASGSACAVWSSARPGRWRSRRKHNGGKYSTRLRTTIGRIAALKSRQTRRRADWNHKLTTDLAKNHGLIAVED